MSRIGSSQPQLQRDLRRSLWRAVFVVRFRPLQVFFSFEVPLYFQEIGSVKSD